MSFILTGFVQDMGCRLFAFERIDKDRTRTEFTVRADLALSRRYGIRMQELPLLCLKVLEQCGESEERRAFTFTEEEMRVYATTCAAMSKKAPRRIAAVAQSGSQPGAYLPTR